MQTKRTKNSRIIKRNTGVLSLKTIGMALFIILSIYNNASWGASFIYVSVPAACFLLYALIHSIRIKPSATLIFVLWFYYFCATLLSQYVEFERDIFSFLAFCVTFVIVASFDFNRKEIAFLFFVYIFVSATVVINIDFNWIIGHYSQDWLKRSSFYIFGKFRDGNYVMAFVTPATIIAIISLFYVKFRIKIILLIYVALAAVAFIAASSRAAILALLLSLIAFIILNTKLEFVYKIILVLFISALILFGYWLIKNNYNDYALERFFHDDDGSGRLKTWKYAMDFFRENWLFGGGYNSGSAITMVERGYATHSVFIDIICDAGVIGAGIFIVVIVLNCLKCKMSNIGFIYPVAIAFFVPLFFINGFNTTTLFFPLMMLAILSNYCCETSFVRIFRRGRRIIRIYPYGR